ncbi:UNVERIFIED_CONTAM: hypothetical protein FKN15_025266 [Acipenser sinensis]
MSMETVTSINKLDKENTETGKDTKLQPTEGAVVRGLDTADSKPGPRGYQHSGSWNLFNGAFYYFSKENKVWKEARTFCQSQNSDLAVINSEEELKYLQDKGPANELWLGLSDSDEEGTWKWLDGRVVEKRLWHKGEPNNYQNNEDCGLLTNGLLNDLTCQAKLHWICEKRL